MKRISLLVLALSVLSATLTAGVRAYSQSRPEDSSAILFGYGVCDGSPCFLGIKPGVTTWDDAQKTVRVHYPSATIDDSIITIISGKNRVYIDKQPNGTVYEIVFDYENARPLLSTLITKFGVPCYVGIYLINCLGGQCPVDYIELHYDTGFVGLNMAPTNISTNIEVERLSFDWPVDQILLSTQYPTPKTPQACFALLNEGANAEISTPWLGFASIPRRYLSYAENRK
jgi:hypothetical protein